MIPSARWHARYEAASARLMSLPELIAVQAAIDSAEQADGRAVMWLGEPPRMASGARVGVLTGSFNPLTKAHTRLMRSAAHALRLTHTVWACSRTAVDKERVERASLVDRLVQMLAYQDARERQSRLAVLAAGLYADQATALSAALPPDARLWLITGFDKIEQIFDARYYADRESALRQLFQSADLAIAPRGHRSGTDLADLLALPENRPYARHVRLLPAQPEMADISSTVARALAAQGTSPAELAGSAEPEGAALALATHAYDARTSLPSSEAIDRYALRHALIVHLTSRPRPSRADHLQSMLNRAWAPTPAGARLRALLERNTKAR